MKLSVALIASAVGLSVSVASVAEPPIGSRLGERLTKDRPLDEATSIRQGHALASCLVNRRALEVKRLLDQRDKDGYATAYKALTLGQIDCFNLFLDNASPLAEGRAFQVPGDILRGLLAEELIRRDAKTYAMLPALPRQLTYSRSWHGATERDVSVDEMATCVSEIAPAETLTLINAPPQSDAEGAAFTAVVPHMGACLRAGVKLTGNRQSLRAALADALYERVANPAPAPTAAPAPEAKPQH